MTQALTTQPTPTDLADAVNAQILAVSEDRIQGFHLDPLVKLRACPA
jgi:hypothetical protein